MFFKKPGISIPLFVVGSLASLLLFGLFLIAIRIQFLPTEETTLSSIEPGLAEASDDSLVSIAEGAETIDKPLINGTDPVLGENSAPLALVQYADFTCSYCQDQKKIFEQALTEFGGKIKLIWKDYPNRNPESASFQAALAGRCAAAQDRFWPYHDLLFANSTDLTGKKFLELAQGLGLDGGDFKKCYNQQATRSAVESNILEADALKISGIPFLFVGDLEFMGELTYEDLKKAIEYQLNQK